MTSWLESSRCRVNCGPWRERPWCWKCLEIQQRRVGGVGGQRSVREARSASDRSQWLAVPCAFATTADDMNSACVARSGALYSTSLQGVVASHSECCTRDHSG